jgi:hypothetical protein
MRDGATAQADHRWATRRTLAVPEVRAELREQLSTDYRQGASIRTLAEAYGHSFGTVRNLLLEAGTVLRPRGRREDHSGGA